MFRFRLGAAAGAAALLATATGLSAARPSEMLDDGYVQTNLVADVAGVAAATDPDLVNPWGMSFGPATFFWLSDNGTGKTTLYNGLGTKQALVVTIPPSSGSPAGVLSRPTGQVFNGSSGFVVSANGVSAPARFIFATEEGTISAWSPTVNLTHAVLTVDRSAAGAVYTGLAVANTASGVRLFAADFRNRTVDIFDSSFQLVGSWAERRMPPRFAPFNVQTINGMVVVTYAKQDQAGTHHVPGPGNGLIDILDPNTLDWMRFATGHGDGGHARVLNSPWGVALAPASFGKLAGALLVGNAGDGRISAFDPQSGHFLGQLDGPDGREIEIEGLWALTFGNGGNAGSRDVLYFAAGPGGGRHGLFGSLQPVM